MIDPKKLLDDFLGQQGSKGGSSIRDKAGQVTQLAKDNPLATGAIVAMLLGSKKGRKFAGGALKLGGMAAIAGLAYKAYQDYQSGQKPGGADAAQEVLPPPSGTAFDTAEAPQGEDAFAFALVRAMIAAARADGHIDDAERARIAERLKETSIGAEAENFLIRELERPVDLDALVAAAETDAQKVELYTASRLAIEPETRAERGYLDMLAGRLKLPDVLVDHIEATVSQAAD
ncbi:tellurite resistance TerB family protein [Nitratireductor sp. GCM10026969]|uniref:tellurite resistance TerB family protein n=1 Tax=Nitratireductor sp. GCM10026969 TaxID=3252645 RepID=UPI0036164E3C